MTIARMVAVIAVLALGCQRSAKTTVGDGVDAGLALDAGTTADARAELDRRAQEAKRALVEEIARNPRNYPEADADTFARVEIKPDETDGVYWLGAFRIDVQERRFSAQVPRGELLLSYQGEFVELEGGRWNARLLRPPYSPQPIRGQKPPWADHPAK
jgi:hypothetical protein